MEEHEQKPGTSEMLKPKGCGIRGGTTSHEVSSRVQLAFWGTATTGERLCTGERGERGRRNIGTTPDPPPYIPRSKFAVRHLSKRGVRDGART